MTWLWYQLLREERYTEETLTHHGRLKKNSTQPNPSHKSNLTKSNPSHKFNQIQPKPHGSGWTYELDKFFLLLLLINWAKKI